MQATDPASVSALPGSTVCPFCGSGCSLLLAGGASHPRLHHPVSDGALCLRGWSAGELLRSPRRVTSAYRRERGRPLAPAPVESVLEEVVDRLAELKRRGRGDRIGILGSARITVEEVVLLRKLARSLGTPHLDTLQRAGYLPFPAVSLDQVENASAITVLAANVTVRQPQVGRRLLRAVDRGARVRFVHSRRVQLSSLAAEHRVVLPGHELEALGDLDPRELVLLSSEVALSGQGAEAVRRLAGRRVMFLTDYANQRGVVEAGLHPAAGGLSAWEMLQRAAAGGLDALLVFADDPFEFFPALSARAFETVGMTVVMDAVKSPTAARADLVLPGALLAEKAGTVVNTEGRVQELVPVSPPPAGWTEGAALGFLLDRLGGDVALEPPAPLVVGEGGCAADRPGAEYPLLASIDTTLFWNTHALIRATTTAWREARSLFADFPPGCVTLNPEDARRAGVQYAGAVRVAGPDGSTLLPVRTSPRMLPGTVWVAMRCWEPCGNGLGALEYDPSLRIPVFRPRAVRLERPEATPGGPTP